MQEEFYGFSDREVAKVENKLLRLTSDLEHFKNIIFKSSVEVPAKTWHTSSDQFGQRRKMRSRQKRLIEGLVQSGHAQPMRESVLSRMTKVEVNASSQVKSSSVRRLKSIKIRLGEEGSEARIVHTRGRPPILEKKASFGKMKVKIASGLWNKKGQTLGKRVVKMLNCDSTEDGVKYSSSSVSETLRRGRRREKREETGESSFRKKQMDVTVAKQILEKARHKRGRPRKQTVVNIKRGVGRPRLLHVNQSNKAYKKNASSSCTEGQGRRRSDGSVKSELVSPPKNLPRKQFIIPVKSTHSSRQIKPNKRFLDEDSGYSTVIPPTRSECSSSVQDGSSVPKSQAGVSGHTLPRVTYVPSHEVKPGLFEEPLIIEGKRERKPSLKLLRKLTDEVEVKRLSERRRWDREEGTPQERKDVSSMKAVRQSGKVILQKAKLCLNQAALNRSKAALVKTLRAEMRKEEKAQRRRRREKELCETKAEANIKLSPESEHENSGHSVRFLPLGSSGFKPVSPLKFSSLSSRETAVFGLSSLPAGKCWPSFILVLSYCGQFSQ